MSECGLNQETVIEHTKTLTKLEGSYMSLRNDMDDIKKLLLSIKKTVCESNGSQSLVDAMAETKARIKSMEHKFYAFNEEKKEQTKWAIDKIIVIGGILANLVKMKWKG